MKEHKMWIRHPSAQTANENVVPSAFQNKLITPQRASQLLSPGVTSPRSLKPLMFTAANLSRKKKMKLCEKIIKGLKSFPEDQLEKLPIWRFHLVAERLAEPQSRRNHEVWQWSRAREAVAEGPTGLNQTRPWATEAGAQVAQVWGSGAKGQKPTNIWGCSHAAPSTKGSWGTQPEHLFPYRTTSRASLT